MTLNAAPSGSRWKSGAATMTPATTFAVVAGGAGNSAAPAAAGSHTAHAGRPPAALQPLRPGERFVDQGSCWTDELTVGSISWVSVRARSAVARGLASG